MDNDNNNNNKIQKIKSSDIQFPNDRGPLFEGTYEFDLLIKPPHTFYWNTNWITHKFHSLYTSNYTNLMEHGLPKQYTSLHLMGDDVSLNEIYIVCSKYKIDLLVVENMPSDGIFDESIMTPLEIKNQPSTFITRNKVNLAFINHTMPDLKHLYVFKLTTPARKKTSEFVCKKNIKGGGQQPPIPRYVIVFKKLETLSCVYASENLINVVVAPILKTIDIFSIIKGTKPMAINLLAELKDIQYLRLDSFLFETLNLTTNLSRLKRIQFYGELDETTSENKVNGRRFTEVLNNFHSIINKEEPGDIIIPMNLFSSEQIETISYMPKSLGVYSQDVNVQKYVEIFGDNLYIYGSRNIHQVLFVRNNIMYCNFNIYNRMNEWRQIYNYFITIKKITDVKICGEIVKQTGFEEMWPSTIYKNKGRQILYNFDKSELNITASTNDVDKIVNLIGGVKTSVQLIKSLVINTSGSSLNQIILSQILNNKKFSILNTIINK